VARKPKGETVDPLEKIARLLAIHVSKDLDNAEAARRLLAAGFDAPAIGGLLGLGPNFANVAKTRKPKPQRAQG
jgi:hypothetical protein